MFKHVFLFDFFDGYPRSPRTSRWPCGGGVGSTQMPPQAGFVKRYIVGYMWHFLTIGLFNA